MPRTQIPLLWLASLLASCATDPSPQDLCAAAASRVASCTGNPPSSAECTPTEAEQILDMTCEEILTAAQAGSGKADCRGLLCQSSSQEQKIEHVQVMVTLHDLPDFQTNDWCAEERSLFPNRCALRLAIGFKWNENVFAPSVLESALVSEEESEEIDESPSLTSCIMFNPGTHETGRLLTLEEVGEASTEEDEDRLVLEARVSHAYFERPDVLEEGHPTIALESPEDEWFLCDMNTDDYSWYAVSHLDRRVSAELDRSELTTLPVTTTWDTSGTHQIQAYQLHVECDMTSESPCTIHGLTNSR